MMENEVENEMEHDTETGFGDWEFLKLGGPY